MKTKKQIIEEQKLINKELTTRVLRLENPPIVALYSEFPVHVIDAANGFHTFKTKEYEGAATVIEIIPIDPNHHISCTQNWYRLLVTDVAGIKKEHLEGERFLAKGIERAANKK